MIDGIESVIRYVFGRWGIVIVYLAVGSAFIINRQGLNFYSLWMLVCGAVAIHFLVKSFNENEQK